MGKRLTTDPVFKEFRDHRVTIPNNFCEVAGIPAKSETIDVILWLVGNGRYRLLSGDQGNHRDVELMRERITQRDEPSDPTASDDAVNAVLNLRLIDTDLGGGKERRLYLPEIVTNLLKVKKYGGVQVVLNGKFVEIWSIQALDDACSVPTADIL